MLSKNKIKYLQSLKLKKFRQKYNNFLAEGEKIVTEILSQDKIKLEALFGTSEWITENPRFQADFNKKLTIVTEKELVKISQLKTPNKVLAIVEKPAPSVDNHRLNNGLSLYLDGIRDPGNMGTILRIADWFGLDYLFTSLDSADIYHPKVIQSSMGAFLRVPSIRLEFSALREMVPELKTYGMVLEGESLFKQSLDSSGIIVIGNESKGISPEVKKQIDMAISIPPGPGGNAESLNAAVATGIVCAIFRN